MTAWIVWKPLARILALSAERGIAALAMSSTILSMAVIVWEKSEARFSRVLSYDSMPNLVMLASYVSISSGRANVDD